MPEPIEPVGPVASPAPVLAYATPVSKRQVNKPLRTRIVPEPAEEGVGFREISDDRGRAIAAMIFCALTMVALCASGNQAMTRWIRSGFSSEYASEVIIVAVTVLAQITTIAFVFQQTWRETRLYIRDGMLTLDISAPVGSRRRQWPVGEVLDIRAWAVHGVNRGIEPLCELQVQASGEPVVSVFRNYGQRELEWVASTLVRALGR